MRMLYLLCVICIICDNGINAENVTNTLQNITNSKISGKTYFLQFRKTGDAPDAPQYVRINHYGNDNEFIQRKDELIRRYEHMFGKLSEAPENLKEFDSIKQDKELQISDNFIDHEWSFNINHTNYDLPNITHDIYEAMLENNKHNTIKNASIVKFFFEIDTNLTSNIIKFNTDSLHNMTEKLIDAELHVYRLPRDSKSNETKSNATENVVRIYQRMDDNENDEEQNVTTVRKNPDLHKLAHVIYISSNYAGWQVFKVKNVIENWKKGEDNLGFLISTTDSWENDFKVDFAHRERNGGKYQPTLVVYLDRDEAGNKRHIRKHKQKKQPRLPNKTLYKELTPCSRHIWYISFHELGWNNFIIAPNGYMAYQCKGNCKSPLSTNYSNHGILLNVYQSRRNNGMQPCCVANHYKSLTIMFYDLESNVVIKEYDDMVVNSCGCR